LIPGLNPVGGTGRITLRVYHNQDMQVAEAALAVFG